LLILQPRQSQKHELMFRKPNDIMLFLLWNSPSVVNDAHRVGLFQVVGLEAAKLCSQNVDLLAVGIITS